MRSVVVWGVLSFFGCEISHFEIVTRQFLRRVSTSISKNNADRHFSKFALQRNEKGKKIDAKHRSMDEFH